jgi:hypothetical protein
MSELDTLLNIRKQLETLSPAALHLLETSIMEDERQRRAAPSRTVNVVAEMVEREKMKRREAAGIAPQGMVRDLADDAIPEFFNRDAGGKR